MRNITSEMIGELREIRELLEMEHRQLCTVDLGVNGARLRDLVGWVSRTTAINLTIAECLQDGLDEMHIVVRNYRDAVTRRCSRAHCQRRMAQGEVIP